MRDGSEENPMAKIAHFTHSRVCTHGPAATDMISGLQSPFQNCDSVLCAQNLKNN